MAGRRVTGRGGNQGNQGNQGKQGGSRGGGQGSSGRGASGGGRGGGPSGRGGTSGGRGGNAGSGRAAGAARAGGRSASAGGRGARSGDPLRAAGGLGASGGLGGGPGGSRGGFGDRHGLGGEQVEGRQAVRELLRAGRRRVHEVWFADDLDPAPILDEIADLADDARVPLRRVPRTRLDHAARSEAPQGVLAQAVALEETDLGVLAATGPGGQRPFLLALDGVTDPVNLGALLRSAACAGVTGVVLPRHRAVHVTPTATKAAAGAIEYVRIAVVPGLPAALASLKEAGVWVVGLQAEGGSLWGMSTATEPVCLVLGAEGQGLGRLVRERCDLLVGIPHVGPLDSLNVSAAGAVACFEVARIRGSASAGLRDSGAGPIPSL